MSLHLVATCAVGLEELVSAELRALGAEQLQSERGAVVWSGSWRDVWRANWRLRTANRVLVELMSWPAATGDDLASGAERLVVSSQSWDGVRAGDLFDPSRTFALRSTAVGSQLRDTRWISLKLKDGLVDSQRRRYGRRASVDRRSPDLALRVRLRNDRATLLLDTSGRPLDHRGYRVDRGAAPVREQLAAACVLAADWDGEGAVLDLMCGSGTLLAEAGAWARGLAPGRLRRRWSFETLPGFDEGAWRAIRREPIPAPAPSASLRGLDRSPREVAAARANLERAGLASCSRVTTEDAFAHEPTSGRGLLLVNPPWGERLGAAQMQWPRLGDLLKHRYAGWRAVVLAGDDGRGKHVGLRPRRRIPVRNGPLDARILVFDIY